MKNLQIFLSTLIILLLFTYCSKEESQKITDLSKISFEHSMKGWELYSWNEGNTWNFSILPGTNRIKTIQEVVNNTIVVSDTNSLKTLLDKFPEGEEIFWLSFLWSYNCSETVSSECIHLPPVEMVDEILEYCENKGLNMQIVYQESDS